MKYLAHFCFLFVALMGVSAEAQVTVVPTAVDATFFEVSPTDARVDLGLNRVGSNDAQTFEFVTLIAFDVSEVSVADLRSSRFELGFDLNAIGGDGGNGLEAFSIDYLGTFESFSDNELGVDGVNGANALAVTLATSPVVRSVFSGPQTPASGLTFDAPIDCDSFSNSFAVFRLSDPTVDTQFDIPGMSATLTITLNTPNCLLGDANLDGVVNILDIPTFLQVLTSGAFQCEVDMNQDGIPNILDVTPFILTLNGGVCEIDP